MNWAYRQTRLGERRDKGGSQIGSRAPGRGEVYEGAIRADNVSSWIKRRAGEGVY